MSKFKGSYFVRLISSCIATVFFIVFIMADYSYALRVPIEEITEGMGSRYVYDASTGRWYDLDGRNGYEMIGIDGSSSELEALESAYLRRYGVTSFGPRDVVVADPDMEGIPTLVIRPWEAISFPPIDFDQFAFPTAEEIVSQINWAWPEPGWLNWEDVEPPDIIKELGMPEYTSIYNYAKTYYESVYHELRSQGGEIWRSAIQSGQKVIEEAEKQAVDIMEVAMDGSGKIMDEAYAQAESIRRVADSQINLLVEQRNEEMEELEDKRQQCLMEAQDYRKDSNDMELRIRDAMDQQVGRMEDHKQSVLTRLDDERQRVLEDSDFYRAEAQKLEEDLNRVLDDEIAENNQVRDRIKQELETKRQEMIDEADFYYSEADRIDGELRNDLDREIDKNNQVRDQIKQELDAKRNEMLNEADFYSREALRTANELTAVLNDEISKNNVVREEIRQELLAKRIEMIEESNFYQSEANRIEAYLTDTLNQEIANNEVTRGQIRDELEAKRNEMLDEASFYQSEGNRVEGELTGILNQEIANNEATRSLINSELEAKRQEMLDEASFYGSEANRLEGELTGILNQEIANNEATRSQILSELEAKRQEMLSEASFYTSERSRMLGLLQSTLDGEVSTMQAHMAQVLAEIEAEKQLVLADAAFLEGEASRLDSEMRGALSEETARMEAHKAACLAAVQGRIAACQAELSLYTSEMARCEGEIRGALSEEVSRLEAHKASILAAIMQKEAEARALMGEVTALQSELVGDVESHIAAKIAQTGEMESRQNGRLDQRISAAEAEKQEYIAAASASQGAIDGALAAGIAKLNGMRWDEVNKLISERDRKIANVGPYYRWDYYSCPWTTCRRRVRDYPRENAEKAAIRAEYDGYIAQVHATYDRLIAELTAEANAIKPEYYNSYMELATGVDETISGLNDAKGSVTEYFDGVRSELDSAGQECIGSINEAIGQLMQACTDIAQACLDTAAQVDGEYSAAIADLTSSIEEAITGLNEGFQALIDSCVETIEALTTAYSDIDTQYSDIITELTDSVMEAIESIAEAFAGLIEATTGMAEAIEEAKGEFETYYQEAIATLIEGVEEAMSQVEEAMTTLIDAATETANAVGDAMTEIDSQYTEVLNDFTESVTEGIVSIVDNMHLLEQAALDTAEAVGETQQEIDDQYGQQIDEFRSSVEENIQALKDQFELLHQAALDTADAVQAASEEIDTAYGEQLNEFQTQVSDGIQMVVDQMNILVQAALDAADTVDQASQEIDSQYNDVLNQFFDSVMEGIGQLVEQLEILSDAAIATADSVAQTRDELDNQYAEQLEQFRLQVLESIEMIVGYMSSLGDSAMAAADAVRESSETLDSQYAQQLEDFHDSITEGILSLKEQMLLLADNSDALAESVENTMANVEEQYDEQIDVYQDMTENNIDNMNEQMENLAVSAEDHAQAIKDMMDEIDDQYKDQIEGFMGAVEGNIKDMVSQADDQSQALLTQGKDQATAVMNAGMDQTNMLLSTASSKITEMYGEHATYMSTRLNQIYERATYAAEASALKNANPEEIDMPEPGKITSAGVINEAGGYIGDITEYLPATELGVSQISMELAEEAAKVTASGSEDAAEIAAELLATASAANKAVNVVYPAEAQQYIPAEPGEPTLAPDMGQVSFDQKIDLAHDEYIRDSINNIIQSAADLKEEVFRIGTDVINLNADHASKVKDGLSDFATEVIEGVQAFAEEYCTGITGATQEILLAFAQTWDSLEVDITTAQDQRKQMAQDIMQASEEFMLDLPDISNDIMNSFNTLTDEVIMDVEDQRNVLKDTYYQILEGKAEMEDQIQDISQDIQESFLAVKDEVIAQIDEQKEAMREAYQDILAASRELSDQIVQGSQEIQDAFLGIKDEVIAQVDAVKEELRTAYDEIMVAKDEFEQGIRDSSQEIQDSFIAVKDEVIANVDEAKAQMREAYGEILQASEEFADSIVQSSQEIQNAFLQVKDEVIANVDQAKEEMRAAYDELIVASEEFAVQIVEISNEIQEAFLAVKDEVITAVDEAKAEMRSAYDELIAAAEEFATEIVNVSNEIQTAFLEVKDEIITQVDEAKAEMRAAYEEINTAVDETVTAIIDASAEIQQAFEDGKNELITEVEAAREEIRGYYEEILAASMDLIDQIHSTAQEVIDGFQEAIDEIVAATEEAEAARMEAYGDLVSAAEEIVAACHDGANQIYEAFDGFLGEFTAEIDGAFGDIRSSFGDLRASVAEFKAGIDEFMGGVESQIASAVDDAIANADAARDARQNEKSVIDRALEEACKRLSNAEGPVGPSWTPNESSIEKAWNSIVSWVSENWEYLVAALVTIVTVIVLIVVFSTPIGWALLAGALLGGLVLGIITVIQANQAAQGIDTEAAKQLIESDAFQPLLELQNEVGELYNDMLADMTPEEQAAFLNMLEQLGLLSGEEVTMEQLAELLGMEDFATLAAALLLASGEFTPAEIADLLGLSNMDLGDLIGALMDNGFTLEQLIDVLGEMGIDQGILDQLTSLLDGQWTVDDVANILDGAVSVDDLVSGLLGSDYLSLDMLQTILTAGDFDMQAILNALGMDTISFGELMGLLNALGGGDLELLGGLADILGVEFTADQLKALGGQFASGLLVDFANLTSLNGIDFNEYRAYLMFFFTEAQAMGLDIDKFNAFSAALAEFNTQLDAVGLTAAEFADICNWYQAVQNISWMGKLIFGTYGDGSGGIIGGLKELGSWASENLNIINWVKDFFSIETWANLVGILKTEGLGALPGLIGGALIGGVKGLIEDFFTLGDALGSVDWGYVGEMVTWSLADLGLGILESAIGFVDGLCNLFIKGSNWLFKTEWETNPFSNWVMDTAFGDWMNSAELTVMQHMVSLIEGIAFDDVDLNDVQIYLEGGASEGNYFTYAAFQSAIDSTAHFIFYTIACWGIGKIAGLIGQGLKVFGSAIKSTSVFQSLSTAFSALPGAGTLIKAFNFVTGAFKSLGNLFIQSIGSDKGYDGFTESMLVAMQRPGAFMLKLFNLAPTGLAGQIVRTLINAPMVFTTSYVAALNPNDFGAALFQNPFAWAVGSEWSLVAKIGEGLGLFENVGGDTNWDVLGFDVGAWIVNDHNLGDNLETLDCFIQGFKGGYSGAITSVNIQQMQNLLANNQINFDALNNVGLQNLQAVLTGVVGQPISLQFLDLAGNIQTISFDIQSQAQLDALTNIAIGDLQSLKSVDLSNLINGTKRLNVEIDIGKITPDIQMAAVTASLLNSFSIGDLSGLFQGISGIDINIDLSNVLNAANLGKIDMAVLQGGLINAIEISLGNELGNLSLSQLQGIANGTVNLGTVLEGFKLDAQGLKDINIDIQGMAKIQIGELISANIASLSQSALLDAINSNDFSSLNLDISLSDLTGMDINVKQMAMDQLLKSLSIDQIQALANGIDVTLPGGLTVKATQDIKAFAVQSLNMDKFSGTLEGLKTDLLINSFDSKSFLGTVKTSTDFKSTLEAYKLANSNLSDFKVVDASGKLLDFLNQSQIEALARGVDITLADGSIIKASSQLSQLASLKLEGGSFADMSSMSSLDMAKFKMALLDYNMALESMGLRFTDAALVGHQMSKLDKISKLIMDAQSQINIERATQEVGIVQGAIEALKSGETSVTDLIQSLKDQIGEDVLVDSYIQELINRLTDIMNDTSLSDESRVEHALDMLGTQLEIGQIKCNVTELQGRLTEAKLEHDSKSKWNVIGKILSNRELNNAASELKAALTEYGEAVSLSQLGLTTGTQKEMLEKTYGKISDLGKIAATRELTDADWNAAGLTPETLEQFGISAEDLASGRLDKKIEGLMKTRMELIEVQQQLAILDAQYKAASTVPEMIRLAGEISDARMRMDQLQEMISQNIGTYSKLDFSREARAARADTKQISVQTEQLSASRMEQMVKNATFREGIYEKLQAMGDKKFVEFKNSHDRATSSFRISTQGLDALETEKVNKFNSLLEAFEQGKYNLRENQVQALVMMVFGNQTLDGVKQALDGLGLPTGFGKTDMMIPLTTMIEMSLFGDVYNKAVAVLPDATKAKVAYDEAIKSFRSMGATESDVLLVDQEMWQSNQEELLKALHQAKYVIVDQTTLGFAKHGEYGGSEIEKQIYREMTDKAYMIQDEFQRAVYEVIPFVRGSGQSPLEASNKAALKEAFTAINGLVSEMGIAFSNALDVKAFQKQYMEQAKDENGVPVPNTLTWNEAFVQKMADLKGISVEELRTSQDQEIKEFRAALNGWAQALGAVEGLAWGYHEGEDKVVPMRDGLAPDMHFSNPFFAGALELFGRMVNAEKYNLKVDASNVEMILSRVSVSPDSVQSTWAKVLSDIQTRGGTVKGMTGTIEGIRAALSLGFNIATEALEIQEAKYFKAAGEYAKGENNYITENSIHVNEALEAAVDQFQEDLGNRDAVVIGIGKSWNETRFQDAIKKFSETHSLVMQGLDQNFEVLRPDGTREKIDYEVVRHLLLDQAGLNDRLSSRPEFLEQVKRWQEELRKDGKDIMIYLNRDGAVGTDLRIAEGQAHFAHFVDTTDTIMTDFLQGLGRDRGLYINGKLTYEAYHTKDVYVVDEAGRWDGIAGSDSVSKLRELMNGNEQIKVQHTQYSLILQAIDQAVVNMLDIMRRNATDAKELEAIDKLQMDWQNEKSMNDNLGTSPQDCMEVINNSVGRAQAFLNNLAKDRSFVKALSKVNRDILKDALSKDLLKIELAAEVDKTGVSKGIYNAASLKEVVELISKQIGRNELPEFASLGAAKQAAVKVNVKGDQAVVRQVTEGQIDRKEIEDVMKKRGVHNVTVVVTPSNLPKVNSWLQGPPETGELAPDTEITDVDVAGLLEKYGKTVTVMVNDGVNAPYVHFTNDPKVRDLEIRMQNMFGGIAQNIAGRTPYTMEVEVDIDKLRGIEFDITTEFGISNVNNILTSKIGDRVLISVRDIEGNIKFREIDIKSEVEMQHLLRLAIEKVGKLEPWVLNDIILGELLKVDDISVSAQVRITALAVSLARDMDFKAIEAVFNGSVAEIEINGRKFNISQLKELGFDMPSVARFAYEMKFIEVFQGLSLEVLAGLVEGRIDVFSVVDGLDISLEELEKMGVNISGLAMGIFFNKLSLEQIKLIAQGKDVQLESGFKVDVSKLGKAAVNFAVKMVNASSLYTTKVRGMEEGLPDVEGGYVMYLPDTMRPAEVQQFVGSIMQQKGLDVVVVQGGKVVYSGSDQVKTMMDGISQIKQELVKMTMGASMKAAGSFTGRVMSGLKSFIFRQDKEVKPDIPDISPSIGVYSQDVSELLSETVAGRVIRELSIEDVTEKFEKVTEELTGLIAETEEVTVVLPGGISLSHMEEITLRLLNQATLSGNKVNIVQRREEGLALVASTSSVVKDFWKGGITQESIEDIVIQIREIVYERIMLEPVRTVLGKVENAQDRKALEKELDRLEKYLGKVKSDGIEGMGREEFILKVFDDSMSQIYASVDRLEGNITAATLEALKIELAPVREFSETLQREGMQEIVSRIDINGLSISEARSFEEVLAFLDAVSRQTFGALAGDVIKSEKPILKTATISDIRGDYRRFTEDLRAAGQVHRVIIFGNIFEPGVEGLKVFEGIKEMVRDASERTSEVVWLAGSEDVEMIMGLRDGNLPAEMRAAVVSQMKNMILQGTIKLAHYDKFTDTVYTHGGVLPQTVEAIAMQLGKPAKDVTGQEIADALNETFQAVVEKEFSQDMLVQHIFQRGSNLKKSVYEVMPSVVSAIVERMPSVDGKPVLASSVTGTDIIEFAQKPTRDVLVQFAKWEMELQENPIAAITRAVMEASEHLKKDVGEINGEEVIRFADEMRQTAPSAVVMGEPGYVASGVLYTTETDIIEVRNTGYKYNFNQKVGNVAGGINLETVTASGVMRQWVVPDGQGVTSKVISIDSLDDGASLPKLKPFVPSSIAPEPFLVGIGRVIRSLAGASTELMTPPPVKNISLSDAQFRKRDAINLRWLKAVVTAG